MRYYPVQLDVLGQECLVVGGGAVGTRKVRTLLACGARVTVVSRELSGELGRLAAAGRITARAKEYGPDDLEGMFLVIGATDDESLNRRLSADARAVRVLCNIADFPEVSDFILPSILARGDLVITVSTSGKSPAFAKKLRQDLEKEFGEEYGVFLDLMGAIRRKLLAAAHEPEAHKPLFETLIHQGLLDLVRAGQTGPINALLQEVLGEGFEYRALMKAAQPSSQ